MTTRRSVAIVLAPCREAVSGVSTHLDLLLQSRLGQEFALVHFQVGSEGRSEGKISRLARLLFSPILLVVEILRRNAVLVHLNTSLNAGAYWRDLVYVCVAKVCGARVLYQVHGGALPQYFFRGNSLFTAFLRWTLLLPDAIVVLARSELEAYRRFVPHQQVLILPNSIDWTAYAKIEREPSDPSSPLRVVYIGRLAREKGLYELLRAVSLAHAPGTGVRLVVAGSGPEEAPLRRYAAELGIQNLVSFAGPVYGKDKINLLGAADVFVLASYAEGLPYALLESMAAGVPVIATRVGAIPDVLVSGIHGLFVPLRESHAIARAIAMLVVDRELLARMGTACRMRISELYSIDRLAAEFCELYSALRATKRTRVRQFADKIVTTIIDR